MFENHIYVFPIILSIYLPVSFIITYAVAVSYGHVKPGFPYISDTGAFAPESCIFGQLLNIGAVLSGFVMYTRYKQIEQFYGQSSRRRLLIVNKVSFALGVIGCLGVSMVGNFQESTVIVVHLIGAFLAFGVGAVYCYIQTGMSFKMPELPGATRMTNYIRLLICILDFCCLVLLGAVSTASRNKGPHVDHFLWTSDEPGYKEHLTATITEWIIAILTVVYLLTFTKEFKQFRLKPPEVAFYQTHMAEMNGISPENIQTDSGFKVATFIIIDRQYNVQCIYWYLCQNSVMLEDKIYILPIVLGIFLPVTFIITYAIAVANDHVEPWFPYISDTGTFPPESCIFGQLLNIAAVLLCVVMYIRYKQISVFYGNRDRRKLLLANIISFILGMVACLGVSMVGNFQETNILAVHYVGAFLAFGVGGLYCYSQTAMTFKMAELPGTKNCMKYFRCVISVLDFICIVLVLTMARLAADEKNSAKPKFNHYKWTAKDPGYWEHLGATIAEWVLALLTVSFILTFTCEFKEFRLKPPEITFHNKQEYMVASTSDDAEVTF